MQIGVDVGGTNTDGVIMSDGKVLVSDKKVTTANVGDGVFNVIKSVLEKGKISSDKISSVMVGTTHFTNALVERKKLQKKLLKTDSVDVQSKIIKQIDSIANKMENNQRQSVKVTKSRIKERKSKK